MKKWLLVSVILVIALFLRFYHLSSNPPGLTPDEAALGYNAYSILKTGKDEYGKFLPIIFKSFGDYKPGLYVYLSVPSVALLGLNETSVRIPSVISGVVSVVLIYLLVKELFKNEKLAFISLVVAACNPWLIYFSRGAWEANVALMFTLAGAYFFIKGLEKEKYIIVSAIFFALTLITYQGAKLSTAIVLGLLIILYWKQLFKIKFKYLTVAVMTGLVISIPSLLSLVNGQSGRLAVFSVFSYHRPDSYLQNFLDEAQVKKGSITYDLYYGEPLYFLRGILSRFFNHFSPRFLFFEGDWENPRHTPPYQGVLLLADSVSLVFGMVAVMKRKIKKEEAFVLLWLIFAVLPAVLSRDQVQAVRSLQLAVPLILVISFGIFFLLENYRKIFLFILIPVYLATFIYFIDSYFVHNPKLKSQYWQYGYKQIVSDVEPYQKMDRDIIVEDSYDQPYIYFLFYEKYDPARWQTQSKLIQDNGSDVGHVISLDKIKFTNIDLQRNKNDHGTIVVGDPVQISDPIPKEYKLIDDIKYLNGKMAWRVLEVK